MSKINNLKCTYSDFMTVNDVKFTIKKSEIVGLLGHSDAGKITIIKTISRYLELRGC